MLIHIRCVLFCKYFIYIKIIIQVFFNKAQVGEMRLLSDMFGYTPPSLE